jgi:hypothetical protein
VQLAVSAHFLWRHIAKLAGYLSKPQELGAILV